LFNSLNRAAGSYIVVCTLQVSVSTPILDDEFVVLGSDGLFDVFPNRQDLVNKIKRLLKETMDVDEVCKRLVMEAIEERRSADNVSMVLIAFNQNDVVTSTAGALGGLPGYAARACARKVYARNTRNMKTSHEVKELQRHQSFMSDPKHSRIMSNQLADLMAGATPSAVPSLRAQSSWAAADSTLAMTQRSSPDAAEDEEGDELDESGGAYSGRKEEDRTPLASSVEGASVDSSPLSEKGDVLVKEKRVNSSPHLPALVTVM
jgi:hypothetical protein